MAVRDIFKFNRKTFFNPYAWMDWGRIVAQTEFMWSVLKSLFYPPAMQPGCSFEEAMQQYGLSEDDVKDGIVTYRLLALMFLILGLSALFYSIYLASFHASFVGALLALAVAALFFSQAFKYDFWALQMRRRHLGLTFADWKRQYLGD